MPPSLIFSLVSDSEDVSGPEDRELRCFFFFEEAEADEFFRFPDSDLGEFLTEEEAGLRSAFLLSFTGDLTEALLFSRLMTKVRVRRSLSELLHVWDRWSSRLGDPLPASDRGLSRGLLIVNFASIRSAGLRTSDPSLGNGSTVLTVDAAGTETAFASRLRETRFFGSFFAFASLTEAGNTGGVGTDEAADCCCFVPFFS